MEAANFVQLVKHYRHDLLNELQVIKGYIQLGHTEKADESIDKMFQYFNEERRLLSLNIPHVYLWIMAFNLKYTNFKITYDVDVKNKCLQAKDLFIVERLEQIMKAVKKCTDDEVLYQIDIEFKDNIEDCIIALYVENRSDAASTGGKVRINQSELEDIDISSTNSEQVFRFHVTYS